MYVPHGFELVNKTYLASTAYDEIILTVAGSLQQVARIDCNFINSSKDESIVNNTINNSIVSESTCFSASQQNYFENSISYLHKFSR